MTTLAAVPRRPSSVPPAPWQLDNIVGQLRDVRNGHNWEHAAERSGLLRSRFGVVWHSTFTLPQSSAIGSSSITGRASSSERRPTAEPACSDLNAGRSHQTSRRST